MAAKPSTTRKGETPDRRSTAISRSDLLLGDWLAAETGLALLDKQLIAAHVLQVSRTQIIAWPETRLQPAQRHLLESLAERRRAGEPLAYLTGEKAFFHLSFRVDARVLTPRPETERLVELALQLTPRDGLLLDLGTGCGCIAIAVSAKRPDLKLVAADLSAAALAVAADNAERHQVSVQWVQSDWFSGLSGYGPFDCIVSNPPYVADTDPALQTLAFEPQMALRAGAGGMCALERIIAEAPDYLRPGAPLCLEHGADQAQAVTDALARQGLENLQTCRDLAGHERITWGRRAAS